MEKLECCSKWDELQNEWLIEYVEHAGNHEAAKNALLQNQTNAQMLAVGGELSGVTGGLWAELVVSGPYGGQQPDMYDPYNMADGFGEQEIPMATLDNDNMAFTSMQGGMGGNIFFSYNPDGEPEDEAYLGEVSLLLPLSHLPPCCHPSTPCILSPPTHLLVCFSR